MQKIVIIDTGSGNILSLKRAVEKFETNVIVTQDTNQILSSSKIFFPGVGAFKNVMENLKKNKLDEIISKIKEKQIPIFGICLGLQLFFEESEEFGISKGLSVINGRVEKLPFKTITNQKLKIPSIGWYDLEVHKKISNKIFSNFFKEFDEKNKFYFVHSYFVKPKDKEDIMATYNFGGHKIPAIVSKNNFIGCQFHPEKSGEQGLKLINNFIKFV